MHHHHGLTQNGSCVHRGVVGDVCGLDDTAGRVEGILPRRTVFERRAPGAARDDVAATSKALAAKEGIFCGISSGGTFAAALKVAQSAEVGSVILAMLPDTGERYLSTPLFADVPEGPDGAQDLLEGLDY